MLNNLHGCCVAFLFVYLFVCCRCCFQVDTPRYSGRHLTLRHPSGDPAYVIYAYRSSVTLNEAGLVGMKTGTGLGNGWTVVFSCRCWGKNFGSSSSLFQVVTWTPQQICRWLLNQECLTSVLLFCLLQEFAVTVDFPPPRWQPFILKTRALYRPINRSWSCAFCVVVFLCFLCVCVC